MSLYENIHKKRARIKAGSGETDAQTRREGCAYSQSISGGRQDSQEDETQDEKGIVMNYGDLKSHFNDLLNRSDITPALTTRFIDQGIARIQRQLRTPMSERVLNITITSQTSSLTLPSDFLRNHLAL